LTPAPRLPATWVPALLAWAHVYQPEAARQTRAVAHRDGLYDRYLGRLDDLWWAWAARRWASWTRAQRAAHRERADALIAAEASVKEAERTVFLEMEPMTATVASKASTPVAMNSLAAKPATAVTRPAALRCPVCAGPARRAAAGMLRCPICTPVSFAREVAR
jgi:hypothetical protein